MTDEPHLTSASRRLGVGVLAGATIGVFLTTPGQTVGVSGLIDVIALDLGLPRDQVLLLYGLGTFVGILPAPLIGWLVDRHGPRRISLVIAAALAVACLAVAFARGGWTLLIGFTLLRGVAIGGLNLVSLHMVNLWFVRLRGRATAVATMGLAIGGLVVPPLADWVTSAHGWRAAYAAMAVATFGVLVPVGLLLFRDGPDRHGARPDFGVPGPAAPPGAGAELTASQAARTSAFWYLLGLAVLVNAAGTALLLDHVRVLLADGFERTGAIRLLGLVTVAQALATLAAGVLVDHLGSLRVGFAGLALTVLAVSAAAAPMGPVVGVVYAVALGAFVGVLQVVQGAGLAEYFGTRHLGAIRGIFFVAGVSGAALGPLPLAAPAGTAPVAFLGLAAIVMLAGLSVRRLRAGAD